MRNYLLMQRPSAQTNGYTTTSNPNLTHLVEESANGNAHAEKQLQKIERNNTKVAGPMLAAGAVAVAFPPAAPIALTVGAIGSIIGFFNTER